MLYASLQILPLNIAETTAIKLLGINHAINVAIHAGITINAVTPSKIDFMQNISANVAVINARTEAVETVNFLPNMARKYTKKFPNADVTKPNRPANNGIFIPF